MAIRTLQPDGGLIKIAAPTGENESGTKADYRAATYDNYYYSTNENDLQVCDLTDSPANMTSNIYPRLPRKRLYRFVLKKASASFFFRNTP